MYRIVTRPIVGMGGIKVVEDDFTCSRGERGFIVRLGRWSCFFGLGEVVDGVVLESCEGVNLEIDDVQRCSKVDVFPHEVVSHPS